MAVTAVWALWMTAEHVSSMARPTSAAIKQPSDSDHGTGPQREVQVRVAHAEHDSAPMGDVLTMTLQTKVGTRHPGDAC